MVLSRGATANDVGVNIRQGANVLSIVAEVEWASVFGSHNGPLFAVIGETLTRGKLPVRVQRVGRPAIKTVMLGLQGHDLVNRDLDLNDLYNSEDGLSRPRQDVLRNEPRRSFRTWRHPTPERAAIGQGRV